MSDAALVVAIVVGAVVLADGCIALWAPLPVGLELPAPRWLRRFLRWFWLYPRSLRLRGIV